MARWSPNERIEVLGSIGMIEARRNRTGFVSRYRAGQVIDDGLHAGWFERAQPTYASALDHFVRSLDQDGPVTPSLEDGLKAQAIAEAALDLSSPVAASPSRTAHSADNDTIAAVRTSARHWDQAGSGCGPIASTPTSLTAPASDRPAAVV